MLGFFDINPYILYGNWGYEHRKSCKNATTPEGAAPDEEGNCQDCTECNVSSLKLKDTLSPGGAGDPATLEGTAGSVDQFQSNAAITITTTSKTVDFTALSDVTITINEGGTIKNTSGNNLTINSPPLNRGEVLLLDATGTLSGTNVSANGKVTLKGTIKVTSDGNQKLGDKLTLGGGPNEGVGGTLNLKTDAGRKHVTITGTLTIKQAAYTTLKDATGTLGIGKDSPDYNVTYKLVTKDSIILGLNTLNNINASSAKVTLKGIPTSQINIAPQGAGTTGISAISIFGTVTFSTTDGNFGNLKNSGATLNLAQAAGFNVTIKRIKEDGSVDNEKLLTTGENLSPGTMLNISGTSDGTKIEANILVTNPGQLNSGGATTYDLTGGIQGTISGLSNAPGGGTHVTGTLNITNISYDSYELHDVHLCNSLCCYYGKVNLWTQYKYAPDWSRPDDKTTVHAYLWHLFYLLIILMIILGVIFIYSLHYTESSLSRSIINQPKMSNVLSIIFYMYNGSHGDQR